MSQATSPSTGKPYGLARSAACGVWHAPPSTGSGTSARRLAPDRGPVAPAWMTSWCPISGVSWRHRPSQAKGTARCGHGCGMAVSARRRVGCCA